MCGISGIITKEPDGSALEAVARMNRSQALRGPDDEGLSAFGNATLGHRRLSFLDLSENGHQPMFLDDLAIVFNGEIYNFLDIRKELSSLGHSFRTENDAEVILAAFKEWGPASFARFRGMFAFGIYDKSKDELYLARDPYGIKPLYYAKTSHEIIFSSTVRAIKEAGVIELTKDEDAEIAFLLMGSIPLPWTTYKEIHSVRAGSYLFFKGGEAKEIRYYDSLQPFFKKIKPSKEEAVKNIRALLEESVRLHLISDAPLGVFLSGGVDSSVIALLAARGRKEKITTLAVDFEEERFSEKKYREPVLAKIKSDHRETTVRKSDFEAALLDVFTAMDEPTIDGVNTYFVSKAAKDAGVKAVLSGLGSDEIFFGYPNFRKAAALRFLQRIPLLPTLLSLLPRRGADRLVYLKKSGAMYFYLALRGLFSPREIAKLLKIRESRVWETIAKFSEFAPKEAEKLGAADLFSYMEVNFYMANQLLKDTDFMSMRHSIEVRVPFLDVPLVEYLASLPEALKFGSFPKELLISAMGDDLPREVYDRPKMGFTFPFAEWIGADGEHWSKYWALRVKKALFDRN